MTDPLEDFEAFVAPEFQPARFAAELLGATNSQMDMEVDLRTPEKRLGYDIQEVEKRMAQLTSDNYSMLIGQINKMETTTAALDGLKPSLHQTRRSFRKLELEILEPFERALELASALRKLHTTAGLLRGVVHFLHLTRELEDDGDDAQPELMLRHAVAHSQLQQHLDSTPSLRAMAVVRSYLPTALDRRRVLAERCAQVIVAGFTATGPAPTAALSALAILSPAKLREALETVLNTHAQTSVRLMVKTIASPRQFGAVAGEAGTRAARLNRVKTTLDATPLPKEFEGQRGYSMGEWLTRELGATLPARYWDVVAAEFSRKVRSTMSNGGPVAKNLRSHKQEIVQALTAAVMDLDGTPEQVETVLGSLLAMDTKSR